MMAGSRKPNVIEQVGGVLHVSVGVRSFPSAVAIVDMADADIVREGICRWRAARSGRGHVPYVVRRERGQWQSLHREIMAPVPLGMVVDHINGNPLDNRRANLRIVTAADNARNAAPTAGRALSKGVSPFRGGYRARIMVDRKEVHLGTFETEALAAAAYEAATLRYFGDAARQKDTILALSAEDRERIALAQDARVGEIKGGQG